MPDYSNEDFSAVLPEVQAAYCQDYLWLVGTVYSDCPTPGWSGYMEMRTKGLTFEKTAVLPLPFINLDPNNPTAIYTALDFAAGEARRYAQKNQTLGSARIRPRNRR